MLTNGNWTYTWNGENRLIKAENSSTGIKVEFDYDYMGRRIFKKVYSGETLEKHLSFVYDGYKLIEERNALANNAAVRNYVWQPEALDRDVPLTVYDVASEKTYYYHTDANKNVTELSDENGGIVEHYEYSPFGSLTKVSGDYADRNPFRFSSEYFDEETGLIYYNYRYYNPELGRWISRDPIEEQGGYNLYGMIGNNPLYGWDMLGYELCSRCSNLTWSQKLALYLQTKVNNLADDLAGGNYYANVGIYWGAELANGALDNLNFGRDIGDAIYNNNGDWLDKGAQMAPDFTRAGTIILTGAGIAARASGVANASSPTTTMNPFKGKTSTQIDKMLRGKGFEPREPNPINGKGGYVNPKTGRSYHIDKHNSYNEKPHVDVNRPKEYKGPLGKKKYDME